jgi:hypothetical protein
VRGLGNSIRVDSSVLINILPLRYGTEPFKEITSIWIQPHFCWSCLYHLSEQEFQGVEQSPSSIDQKYLEILSVPQLSLSRASNPQLNNSRTYSVFPGLPQDEWVFDSFSLLGSDQGRPLPFMGLA